ncbi:MAG: hypothetical protein WA417_12375 [Stellaceae bacterium]
MTDQVGIPTDGLGRLLTEIHTWLDENWGADGWVIRALLARLRRSRGKGAMF